MFCIKGQWQCRIVCITSTQATLFAFVIPYTLCTLCKLQGCKQLNRGLTAALQANPYLQFYIRIGRHQWSASRSVGSVSYRSLTYRMHTSGWPAVV